jgi:hypothetical protein
MKANKKVTMKRMKNKSIKNKSIKNKSIKNKSIKNKTKKRTYGGDNNDIMMNLSNQRRNYSLFHSGELLKIPKGSMPPPASEYNFIRSTRQGDIYKKKKTAAKMNNIFAALSKLQLNNEQMVD